MTGIDRLRAIAGVWDEWGLGGTLAEIADQIERDFADARMGHVSLMRILEVASDMERHCLGHEGMEDSPVARWARELSYAIKSDASDAAEAQNTSCADPDGAADVTSETPKVTRDPAEDVSMSAYDLLLADERDAIAWVRERGGLDYVKREWRSRVPRDRYEARRQSLLGHIAECETALGRRREIISNLGHRVSDLTCENAELRRRAMPEGMEWPRFEDGEPVRVGDEVCGGGRAFIVDHVVLFLNGESTVCAEADIDSGKVRDYARVRPSYRLKRPAPKVLDADGVEIRVGETVWHICTGDEYSVIGVPSESVINVSRQLDGREIHGVVSPYSLTHRAPVLAADGEPLEVGQTVWHVATGNEYTVRDCTNGGAHLSRDGRTAGYCRADYLTHHRPVLDADGVPIELGDDLYSVEGSLKIHVSNIDRVNCRITTSAMFVLDKWANPSMFTHTKPEPPDSWDALWDDIEDCAVGYESFMRRCRALAERERGE